MVKWTCFIFPKFVNFIYFNKAFIISYNRKKVIFSIYETIYKKTVFFFSKTQNVLFLTYKTLFFNMIFDLLHHKILYLKVIGLNQQIYLKNQVLYLNVGYSHHIAYVVPNEISMYLYDLQNTMFSISTYSRVYLGRLYQTIRMLYPINVYQGHGIFLADHLISLKKIRKK